MTHEEKMKIYDNLHKGCEMMLEKISEYAQENTKFSWGEMMNMSDILKDMSEVEKNIAKACYYSKDTSETML